ncbi:hypothetical protein B0H11DRAFT_2224958 [Mycena galericulata]|nr:hypothetical protein B0H11DRAFT_2224958 [Mycena galericulata]
MAFERRCGARREAGKRVQNPEIESGPQARTDSTAATEGFRASEEDGRDDRLLFPLPSMSLLARAINKSPAPLL